MASLSKHVDTAVSYSTLQKRFPRCRRDSAAEQARKEYKALQCTLSELLELSRYIDGKVLSVERRGFQQDLCHSRVVQHDAEALSRSQDY